MTTNKLIVTFSVLVALLVAAPSQAAITKTELAGNPLAAYPFFEYVHAINVDAAVNIAIDPTRFPGIVSQTCDIYVVTGKTTLQWNTNPTLIDVTTGGALTQTFSGATIQGNTLQVTAPFELSATVGTGLSVGYDVVLDCNQDGLLNGNDFIDGRNNEDGVYIVRDTTLPGPYAVTEVTYSLSNAVGMTFGIPLTHLGEDLFYPSNISSLGQLPLIVVSHGNGHNYLWYDHIGNHLASYGYIVMSHMNDTVPGPVNASTTTLGHTDAFIDQVAQGVIAGGALVGHLDADKIVWIGHSRGAEGVAIAYDRLFDATYVPVNYDKTDIKLISSMLPTDFNGTNVANPHDANFHLWTASGDADVDGSASCTLCQTYHLHDRAVRHRQSTTVQGTGHGWFHNGGGNPWFTGSCSIGQTNTHLIQLGHFLPLVKRYVDDWIREDSIPSIDFLTRQYESFRPIGVPTSDPCIVVTHEYYDGSTNGTVVIDDYQSQFVTNQSSIGGNVTFDVDNLTEDRLDDNNSTFTWMASDPFNGATQGALGGVYSDTSRGVVFDWTGADKYYEWEVPLGEHDLTDNLFLSLRGAQGTQHPNTLTVAGDLTFTVTLRDSNATTSSINIGAFGGGFEQPYQRSGGWHNEMETVRIRLTDFLNNGSGIDLSDVVAVRLNVGPSWGSAQGRVVIDDLVLSNDRAVYDGGDNGDPHLRTVNGVNFDFQSAGEFSILVSDEFEIQARQTPVPSAPPIPNAHTGLTSCVSINTAVAARVAGHRVSYQPSLNQDANPAGMQLRIDGRLIDLNATPSVALGAAARVAQAASGSGIEIDFPDGTVLTAIPGWWGWQSKWYLNLTVVNTPATDGVLGFVPSGGWLPNLPDGSSMGSRPAALATRYTDLNQTFANAWRVTSATSLFDYAPGLSTNDFTNRAWPPRDGTSCNVPGAPAIRPLGVDVAERLCRPIRDKNDRENCVFDVMLTGEVNFAETYLQGQALEQGATTTEVSSNTSRPRLGERVNLVATVRHRKTGQRILPTSVESAIGNVQFTLNGAPLGDPVRLDAFGRAELATDQLKEGDNEIDAIYLPFETEAVLLPSASLVRLHLVVGGKMRKAVD